VGARDVRVVANGDAALTLELGEGIDPDLNARAVAIARQLEAGHRSGIADVVVAYRSVTVYFDPDRISASGVEARLEALADTPPGPGPRSRLVTIPVCYGGDEGPDLEDVARVTGLDVAAVIARHTARIYRVFMMGFSPGFAYLGVTDEELRVPRLPVPRRTVPAGSIGVAERQTCVYPSATPGGWRIIGRSWTPLFEPDRRQPFLLDAGDRVRFEASAAWPGGG